jgi:glycosyltransferase involved in cell wall biosynthesis
MMQLGVAVGIPTFGIFGITSPEREVMPAKNMITITKGLPCERECRKGSWGRRDCERHLECLRSLSAVEVLGRINEHMAVPLTTRAEALKGREVGSMEELSLVYYGYVFDASGYGHAARAYIHALHGVGINLSVVDLAKHSRQVRDELVESLVGRNVIADFHLFHGIPSQWARLAFSLPNAIGMTVWETDRMPTQWRSILNHVLEVWLPCEFNVSTFRNSLEKPIFKLPHPLLPANCNGDCPEPNAFLGTNETDFVFYSIFEWQDRKSPQGMIEAYLRAFPEESKTVLIIKSNPGAKEVAHQMVENARCQLRSQARIKIRCEAWSEGQIKALHDRGDCYVSLHRGEGWCYPLFEAAAQGTPVIATGFSGPLEYLNPQDHNLAKYELIPVNQRYLYYNGLMRWAVPDLAHASELMKLVCSDREMAKKRAAKASEGIKRAYSLESVGAMARERLVRLLKRTQPKKWAYFDKVERSRRYKPQVPIPAEWFDEDYFEKGVKSNWEEGYTRKRRHFLPVSSQKPNHSLMWVVQKVFWCGRSERKERTAGDLTTVSGLLTELRNR